MMPSYLWLRDRGPFSRVRETRRRASPGGDAMRFHPELDRLEGRTWLSTTVNWINPSGGNWDIAANWDSNAVPGPSDDAVIGYSGITVTHNDPYTDAVHSLTSQADLVLFGGSLSLASA